MKKVLFTLFASLAFAFGAIAQDGVKWETGSLQDALKKAAANQAAAAQATTAQAASPAAGPTLVFLDCYTTWCGPCRNMSENIFPQKAAGDYFNSKFINIKIDMEKGEYALSDLYSPNFLFKTENPVLSSLEEPLLQ